MSLGTVDAVEVLTIDTHIEKTLSSGHNQNSIYRGDEIIYVIKFIKEEINDLETSASCKTYKVQDLKAFRTN